MEDKDFQNKIECVVYILHISNVLCANNKYMHPL